MPSMTGGEAVWRTLELEGVDTVFGILGIHLLPLYDALLAHPHIQHLTSRHEQGATAMADGYARTTGRIGVCLTSTGPGTVNTLSALGEAYASSVPVLVIASQVSSDLVDRSRGVLHEARDQLGLFRAMIGGGQRVNRVHDIPRAIQEAMRSMRCGRPRPAYLEICTDVLGASGDVEIRRSLEGGRPAGDPELVRRAGRRLLEARSPLIWAGGGAVDAGVELQRLAELLDAPVLTTTTAKGVVPEDHPLSLGSRTREGPVIELLRESDVLLAVGTRFSWLSTAEWSLPIPSGLIQIDIDPLEIGKNYPVELGIVGDAKLVLRQLLQEVGADTSQRPRGTGGAGRARHRVAAIKERIVEKLRSEGGEAELRVVEDLRSALARDAILACDMTMATYWARVHFPAYVPRSFLYPSGFGGLGFGLPAAIGAKVAWPERQVVCICGDGGFLFTGQELATAMQYNVHVVVLLFNDGGFGVLRHMQDTRYGGRHS